MSKKSWSLVTLIWVMVFTIISIQAKSDQKEKASIYSKKSHAERLWKTSGHADSTAEAFTHWNEEGQIPTYCAKCHSTPGFKDYLADRRVDNAAPVGTTVECEACHTDPENGVVRKHTSVKFPSGAMIENLEAEALCMECHQGRASTLDVQEAIEEAGLEGNEDTVNPGFSFINIHYYAAAASQLGTWTKGGFEYEGKSYDARFSHIKGYNACITCHNPHSLEVDLDSCSTCHGGKEDLQNINFPGSFLTGVKNPKNIRYFGSFVDYDGDGDTDEGIYYEIRGFQGKLYSTIKKYAKNVIGSPIVYDQHTYPYFFYDLNGNGEPDSDETNYGNKYSSFTPRLLKATYNYQMSKKDPAGYAHGGKYIIELLYDSLQDLNEALKNPVNTAGMNRVDEGHFDGSAEAWRHFDEEEEVPSYCAKCHSAEGLPYFLENGETKTQQPANGLLCTTCHTSPPHVRKVESVTFPSGVSKDLGDNSNICLHCHQGRASKFTVDETVASSPGPYSFINIHYFPAGAVLYGSEVHGGYEFDNKSYRGKESFPNHNDRFDTCIECHMGTKSPRKETAGTFTSSNQNFSDHDVRSPNPEDCVYCHGQDVSQPHPGANPDKFEFSGIRPASIPDYNGNGKTSESIQEEINGLEETLYSQIREYAANILGTPVIYDPHSYPYFFYDLNNNGKIDPGENIYPNKYESFDARLLKAAYNYHLSIKEPAAYIHNSHYMAQLLVDSIEHLGGNITPYTWR